MAGCGSYGGAGDDDNDRGGGASPAGRPHEPWKHDQVPRSVGLVRSGVAVGPVAAAIRSNCAVPGFEELRSHCATRAVRVSSDGSEKGSDGPLVEV
jgi:hypothetical protein